MCSYVQKTWAPKAKEEMEKRLIQIDDLLSALGPERTSRDLKLIFDDIVKGFNTAHGLSLITQRISLVDSLELPFSPMRLPSTYQYDAASVKAELKQSATTVLMEGTFVDQAMLMLDEIASSTKVDRFATLLRSLRAVISHDFKKLSASSVSRLESQFLIITTLFDCRQIPTETGGRWENQLHSCVQTLLRTIIYEEVLQPLGNFFRNGLKNKTAEWLLDHPHCQVKGTAEEKMLLWSKRKQTLFFKGKV